MKMEQSVPKRRYIKLRRPVITQKQEFIYFSHINIFKSRCNVRIYDRGNNAVYWFVRLSLKTVMFGLVLCKTVCIILELSYY